MLSCRLKCSQDYQMCIHTELKIVKMVKLDLQMHGKKILKLLQKIFSWLPLATVIDHKVLIVHGGISDTTDLDTIARMDRHKVREQKCIWGILQATNPEMFL